MHNTVKNLIDIENNIKVYLNNLNIDKCPKIIAVSKTFKINQISPLIEYGHVDYGENKVQEAIEKWIEIKKINSKVRLHMIGKLQTNKVKFLIPLFDYFHSLDNLKLARKISEEEIKKKTKIKIFIQVNIGNEDQKNGVGVDYLDEFYSICVNELKLDIIGLMCLPPNNEKTLSYFSAMQKLTKKLSLKELSLGMSNDYIYAIEYGSTFIRIGSKIFGQRSK